MARYDYLIVGCGFAGSVLAERLASQHGARILMIDKRGHVGGNAYDEKNADGILYHKYGPHIFHTNSDEIFAYLSRFTRWRPYEHRVRAHVRDRLVPIPINRTTLNSLFGAGLRTDEEAARFLAARAEPVADIRTSEDVVINAVGRELYALFFRGYTRKQWGLDPSELDKQVTSRIPTRTNTDDRYFTDTFQAMPKDGFTKMFERMTSHPLIDKKLGVDFRDVRDQVDADHIVYTGPIDEYFDFRFGKLPYRSLKFDHQTLDQERFQEVAVVNYPSEDVPFTRISEYKHLTGQQHPKTSITYEYPSAEGDPYYPIPRPENQALFKRYEALADDHRYPAIVGACDALEQLRARGHSLWIVTKRSRSRLAQRMNQAGLAPSLFTGIFAYEDQPASKPDPRCFEPVWRALGRCTPEHSVYVGDRADDQQYDRQYHRQDGLVDGETAEIHDLLPAGAAAAVCGVTLAPTRARWMPSTMTRSSAFNPSRMTRRPSSSGPSVTGFASTVLSSFTTKTILRDWSVAMAVSGSKSAS